jgi:hypothetical protein
MRGAGEGFLPARDDRRKIIHFGRIDSESYIHVVTLPGMQQGTEGRGLFLNSLWYKELAFPLNSIGKIPDIGMEIAVKRIVSVTIQPAVGAFGARRGVAEKRFCRKVLGEKTFGAQGGRTRLASVCHRPLGNRPPSCIVTNILTKFFYGG